jgi:hypothetical protein
MRYKLIELNKKCKRKCHVCEAIRYNILKFKSDILPDIEIDGMVFGHNTQANHFIECIHLRSNEYNLPDNFNDLDIDGKIPCIVELFEGTMIDERYTKRHRNAI